MNRGAILFVDDEADLRAAAQDWLSVVGFAPKTAGGAQEALDLLAAAPFDVLVTDIRMPGMDGMALLDAAHMARPTLPVVLLTGHGDIAVAVDAMRRGAHDFLEKPYNADHLVAVLDRAVAEHRLQSEVTRLRDAAGERELEARLIGASPQIQGLRDRVRQLAGVDVDVLILGETGTGKEVVARALHDFGKRGDRQFVALNCAAIPETVFESEMFGHRRGAFTGAVASRTGRIEYAHGGTVFLDEIESMPLALQAKLLRVLQERMITPLGSNNEIALDVRFIAATKVDLGEECRAGRFRDDLYYRLTTVTLAIPPLRNRASDIGLLFAHFAGDAARRHGRSAPEIGPTLAASLAAAKWPGNVRELKAAAERHVLGLPLDGRLDDLRTGTESGGNLSQRVAGYEALLIREALDTHGGNIQAASTALGLPRRTLAEKIARHGLRREDDLDAAG